VTARQRSVLLTWAGLIAALFAYWWALLSAPGVCFPVTIATVVCLFAVAGFICALRDYYDEGDEDDEDDEQRTSTNKGEAQR
jgi:4-hydroxybenzoate polyprenyltransferase